MARQTNMATSGSTTSSITVRGWYYDDNINNGATIAIFYCDGVEFNRQYASNNANWTTSWVTKTGLNAGTSYRFHVAFHNNVVWLANTSNFYYSTTANPTPTKPGLPYNINSSVNSNSATITFTKGSSATGTRIYKYWDGQALTTTGTSFSFSNLSWNTWHYFDLQSYNTINGDWTSIQQFYIGNPPTPTVPTAPTLYLNNEDYRYEGGFIVQWGTSTNATKYKLKLKVNGQSDASAIYYETTSTNYTFNSGALSYGVSYNLSVCGVNSSGTESSYSAQTIIPTRPKKPTLFVSSTSTSISVVVSGLTGNYDSAYVYLRNASGSGLDTKILTGNGQTATFTGLTASTDYQIDARTYLSVSGTFLFSFYTVRYPIKTSNRPLNWTWHPWEIDAFNNQGQTTALLYTRWNEFIDKVNEFRIYRNLSTVGGEMTSGDRNLYASSFRIVAQGIRDMTTSLNSSLTTVVINDMVYGWYFNHLAAALENII